MSECLSAERSLGLNVSLLQVVGTYARMVKYKKVITLKCRLLGVVGTYAQMF